MRLYQDNGYVDIRAIKNLGLPFNFLVGGRAIGKTYTALKTQIEDCETFMFMRRTQAQADLINKPQFSPMKPLNRDNGWNIGTVPITKYNSAFYNMVEDGEKNVPEGLPLGYTCALSTISNMRGFDASDVKTLIYDEFIPEKHERPLKSEGAAFLNAYETINRNRELDGGKPLQVLALANANDLANPLFLELGIVEKANTMWRRGQESSILENRGVGIFLFNKSPISEQKRNTALYKLSQNSDFSKMSLENNFNSDTGAIIKSRPIAEYKPVVSVGEICIYRHKSNGMLYVSTHHSGTPPTFGTSDSELERFRRCFGWVWLAHMSNRVEFEKIMCEILLTKYVK